MEKEKLLHLTAPDGLPHAAAERLRRTGPGGRARRTQRKAEVEPAREVRIRAQAAGRRFHDRGRAVYGRVRRAVHQAGRPLDERGGDDGRAAHPYQAHSGRGIAQRKIFLVARDVDLRKKRARDGAQSRRAGRRRGRQARDDPPPAREHQPQRRRRHLRLHHPLGAGIRKSFAPHNTRSSAQAEASHRRRAWICKDRMHAPSESPAALQIKKQMGSPSGLCARRTASSSFFAIFGQNSASRQTPRERSSACFPSV